VLRASQQESLLTVMTARRHPHPDRVAEVYRREASIIGPRFVFVGYAADPPPHATWSEDLSGWILEPENA
jgi:hypothetical protein